MDPLAGVQMDTEVSSRTSRAVFGHYLEFSHQNNENDPNNSNKMNNFICKTCNTVCVFYDDLNIYYKIFYHGSYWYYYTDEEGNAIEILSCNEEVIKRLLE